MLEKLSHTVAHFCREPKLVAASIIIVVRFQSATWLVGIAAQKAQNRLPQINGILLQIVEEIDPEVFRTNITFPSADNLGGMRPEQHTWNQQIANDFLRIGGIKATDHPESHAHGQLRPCSLDRIARHKDDFQIRKLIND